MPIQMNIAEAKAKLSELVARAEAGEEVILARDGKPVAVLKPISQLSNEPRRLGILAHLGEFKILDPNWDKPDPADADFLDQSFEEDAAEFPPSKKTP